jgi:hypothetical protein
LILFGVVGFPKIIDTYIVWHKIVTGGRRFLCAGRPHSVGVQDIHQSLCSNSDHRPTASPFPLLQAQLILYKKRIEFKKNLAMKVTSQHILHQHH